MVLVGRDGPFQDGRRFPVEEVWAHQGRLVIKFDGVDTIEEAERFRGFEVCVPRSERLPVEEGSYPLADLVGCRVERLTGDAVGSVEGWMESGPSILLEVRSPDGDEILVPFAGSICREIDLAAKLIRVELPEGLIELNRK